MLLVFTSALAASGLPAVGDVLLWQHSARTPPICALPFALADGLLPGESLQIHLHEPHQLALFETAMKRDHGCVCQLLEAGGGDGDEARISSVSPLLELREHLPHHEVGVWCSFVCVGATRLSAVELRTAAEEAALSGGGLLLPESSDAAAAAAADRGDGDGAVYLVAEATLLREPLAGDVAFASDGAGGGADEEDHAEEAAAAAAAAAAEEEEEEEGACPTVDYDSADDEVAFLLASVEQQHAAVNQLRRLCMELNRDGARSASDFQTSGGDRLGPPPSASDRVEYGHRLGPLVGPHLDLADHVALRSEALRGRGVDAPPDADLARVAELWRNADSEAARRSLLGYVAVEALSAATRLGALQIEDTAARLEFALRALQRRQVELTAEVALRRAVG